MTTIKAPQSSVRFRLPDIPEKHPDDMTSVDNLHQYGAIANIVQYLDNPETTIVSAEHYIVPGPAYVAGESRYPDLLVAFDVNPEAYAASNGYIVSEQGKPPDFVLEVASRHTARDDLGVKKDYYERIGVGELWLFDSEGEFYGFTLRGIGWWMAGTRRYRRLKSRRECSGDTARRWVWTCGRRTLTWAGTTRARRTTFPPWKRKPPAPTWNAPPGPRPPPGPMPSGPPASGSRPEPPTPKPRADAERETRLRAEARVEELEAELHRIRNG